MYLTIEQKTTEPFSIMFFFLKSFVFAQLEGKLLWPERGEKKRNFAFIYRRVSLF